MTNHIDLREFVASGRFFGLGPTSSRDDVVAALGTPDYVGRDPRGAIFLYGGIELHFNDADRLALIHFDYPNLPPSGSQRLAVSPWVLADELPLSDVLSACDDCNIELQCLSDDPTLVYRASSGVSLTFYEPHDPDRTGLVAVSLAFTDGDR